MASIGFSLSRFRFVRSSFSKIILLLTGLTTQKLTYLKIQPASISRRTSAYFAVSLSWIVFAASEKIIKNMATLLKDADSLYNETEYKKVYDLLIPFKDDNNDEILWRLARATFEMAKLNGSNDDKKNWNIEAHGYIDKALNVNDNNGAAHKWKAILLDVISGYEGTKAKITKSEQIKHHITRATELNPSDPTSYYILGVWCYSVADLPWYQRQIASAIFATPPTSSYEEALAAFEKAESIESKFYSMNLLMLGKCYSKLNQQQKAIEFLKQAASFPLLTEDDKKANSEARELLKSLKVTL